MDKLDNYIVLYTQMLSIHEQISLLKKKKFAVLLLVINIPDRLYEHIYDCLQYKPRLAAQDIFPNNHLYDRTI
jgi:hypothetical protein